MKQVVILKIQTTGPDPVQVVFELHEEAQARSWLDRWYKGELKGIVGDVGCLGPWLVKGEDIVAMQVNHAALPTDGGQTQLVSQPQTQPVAAGVPTGLQPRRLPPGTSGLPY